MNSQDAAPSQNRLTAPLYRMIWRWHFYAGLFVLPFIIILSLSGSLYLFKPQIERWEERAFAGQSMVSLARPHEQVDAALLAHPGASLLDYRLPERAGDSALIRLALANGRVREVFVSPSGAVLGALNPDERIMAITKAIHSELLIGTPGNRIVELAACWTIVMILSGLYLWWPRGRGLAGVVWPRWRSGKRLFWRDMHAVTGFWISGLALALLVSGLPWTGIWGKAFGMVRAEMGWVKTAPGWAIDGVKPAAAQARAGGHGHHAGHSPEPAMQRATIELLVLDKMDNYARAERLAFPAIITPPGAPGRFGAPGVQAWTIRSEGKVPLSNMLIRYDLTGEREISREGFADAHAIDRAVAYGIAWHEGRLFGWVNQLIGLLTAAGLVTLCVSGFIMWRRRKPDAVLGAPPRSSLPPRIGGVAAILLILALLLPLLAASLLVLWLFDWLILPRLPLLARWLGVA